VNEEAAAVKAVQAAVPKDAASVEAKAPSAPSPPSSSGKYVPSMIVIPSGRPVPRAIAAQPAETQPAMPSMIVIPSGRPVPRAIAAQPAETQPANKGMQQQAGINYLKIFEMKGGEQAPRAVSSVNTPPLAEARKAGEVPKEVPSVSAGAAQPVKSQTTERQPVAPLATQPAGDTGKTRRGVVEKVSQAETRIAIVTGLFRPEDNIRTHAGTLVHAAGGLEGVLIGPFAKAGKCRVEFPLDCEIQPGAFVTL
jgi:hypothetical protein